MNRYFLMMAAVLTAVFAACKKNSASFTPDCSTAKTFAADANPVIQATCANGSNCHGSGSSQGPGALVSYQQIYNARNSIRSSVANGSMPENGSLSDAQKNAVLCWIDNGAQNN